MGCCHNQYLKYGASALGSGGREQRNLGKSPEKMLCGGKICVKTVTPENSKEIKEVLTEFPALEEEILRQEVENVLIVTSCIRSGPTIMR